MGAGVFVLTYADYLVAVQVFGTGAEKSDVVNFHAHGDSTVRKVGKDQGREDFTRVGLVVSDLNRVHYLAVKVFLAAQKAFAELVAQLGKITKIYDKQTDKVVAIVYQVENEKAIVQIGVDPATVVVTIALGEVVVAPYGAGIFLIGADVTVYVAQSALDPEHIDDNSGVKGTNGVGKLHVVGITKVKRSSVVTGYSYAQGKHVHERLSSLSPKAAESTLEKLAHALSAVILSAVEENDAVVRKTV